MLEKSVDFNTKYCYLVLKATLKLIYTLLIDKYIF